MGRFVNHAVGQADRPPPPPTPTPAPRPGSPAPPHPPPPPPPLFPHHPRPAADPGPVTALRRPGSHRPDRLGPGMVAKPNPERRPTQPHLGAGGANPSP